MLRRLLSESFNNLLNSSGKLSFFIIFYCISTAFGHWKRLNIRLRAVLTVYISYLTKCGLKVTLCCLVSLVFSHGYYLFFGLHKEHWLAIERALTDAKNAPKEQKDSSPSVESSHPSPRSSTSKDDEGSGDEHEASNDAAEEDKDEYECVVSWAISWLIVPVTKIFVILLSWSKNFYL